MSIRDSPKLDKIAREAMPAVDAGTIPLVVSRLNGDPEVLDAALDALALDDAGHSAGLAVLTSARSGRLATNVVARLEKRGHRPESIVPPAGGIISRFAAGWTRIPAGTPGARFPEISVMRSLAPPRPVLMVLDSEAENASPVERLVSYVHPRLATAVRLSRPGAGAAADVALGLRIAGVLLSATIEDLRLLAATPDLVAAQLLALAFQRLATPDDDDLIGPWEDPVVQRATELALGAIHPGQLALDCGAPGDQAMISLCLRLRLLLGLS